MNCCYMKFIMFWFSVYSMIELWILNLWVLVYFFLCMELYFEFRKFGKVLMIKFLEIRNGDELRFLVGFDGSCIILGIF